MLNTLLVPPLGEVHGVTSGSAQWQHGKWGNLYVCECFFFFTPQSAQDGTTQSETYEWNKFEDLHEQKIHKILTYLVFEIFLKFILTTQRKCFVKLKRQQNIEM